MCADASVRRPECPTLTLSVSRASATAAIATWADARVAVRETPPRAPRVFPGRGKIKEGIFPRTTNPKPPPPAGLTVGGLTVAAASQ